MMPVLISNPVVALTRYTVTSVRINNNVIPL